MGTTLGAGDLIRFHSGLKASDLKNWKHVPASAVVQPTAEMKAELAAREANVAQVKAEYDAETTANLGFYAPKSESDQMVRTNVAGLDSKNVEIEMSIVTRLIQSGESEKRSFHASNGDQATTSVHQYLYWLQQRAQALDSDGTYSPEMFK